MDARDARIQELEAALAQREEADRRAVEMWKGRTGETINFPDHVDLCVWLFERMGEMARDLAAMRVSKG